MAVGSDTSAGSGNYLWVQTISSASYVWRHIGGKIERCAVTPGLDTAFPYSYGSNVNPAVLGLSSVTSATSDQPSIDVNYYHPNAVKVTANLNAKMHLLWQSSTPNSIPVPLGAVQWQYIEVSDKDKNSALGWTTPSIVATHGQFSLTLPEYPTWTAVATHASC